MSTSSVSLIHDDITNITTASKSTQCTISSTQEPIPTLELAVIPKFKRFLGRVDYFTDGDDNRIIKYMPMSKCAPQKISGYAANLTISRHQESVSMIWIKSPDPTNMYLSTSLLNSEEDSWCNFNSTNLSKDEIRQLLLSMLHENSSYK